jgi:hypothetical protein
MGGYSSLCFVLDPPTAPTLCLLLSKIAEVVPDFVSYGIESRGNGRFVEFFEVAVREEAEAILLLATSALQTDGFHIDFGTTSGHFAYHHWRAGKHLRTIIRGLAPGGDWCVEPLIWIRVEGEQEPWEKEAFFTARALSCALVDFQGTDEARMSLEQYHKTGRLVQGEREPIFNNSEGVWAIRKHFEFPEL